MVPKKTSLLNRFLIGFLLFFANILKILDFKLRNLFIFFNVIVCAFFLMVYVKPMLDLEMQKERSVVEISLPNDNLPIKEQEIKIEKTSFVSTNPSTEASKKIIVRNLNQDSLSARSVLVFDLKNNDIVYEKNKNMSLPPASLVKMLSAMFFYEKINFEELYTTFSECNFVEGQKVGFKKGEKVSGKDLMNSSLVFSGGDSICNMYKITGFNIEEFNTFAKSLGMNNSNFTNFIGLDYPGNFTTSEDLLVMTKEFIKNQSFNQIVSLKSYKMSNGKILYNTNRMLFEDKNAVGIKTGTTLGAKENLIYRHVDKQKDIDVLIIILNSNKRYQDTKSILNSLN